MNEARMPAGRSTDVARESVATVSQRPFLAPVDLNEFGFDYALGLADPGEFPYTRGIEANNKTARRPIVGQYGGLGDAEQANRIWQRLLADGATAMYVALDLPTQIGLDSDHPLAVGEVGRVGVAIDSLLDFERLFEDIDLGSLRVISTTANSIGPTALAMFVLLCERRGLSPTSIQVSLQNDILKEYVARGTYIYPPSAGLKLTIDVAEYCARFLPTWRPLTICGSHMRGAGATAEEEAAFAIANGLVYARELVARQIPVDEAIRKWELQLGIGVRLLSEVARIRAARRIWARLLFSELGATSENALKLHIRAICSGVTMTAQQPMNNIVRATIETLAGLLGNAQHLRVYPFDEALGLPTADSQELALRTQQILMEETDVLDAIDPLGGSYFIESLTEHFDRRISAILGEIEEAGGAVAAVTNGYYEARIADSAYKNQVDIESGVQTVVGVNKYRRPEHAQVEILRPDPSLEEKQSRRLVELRRTRDTNAVRRALTDLETAAKRGDNVVPATIESVRHYATVGEISDTLREVYGVF